MTRNSYSFFFIVLLFASIGLQKLSAQPVTTENAELELISEQSSVAPGDTFWIGIRMDMRDGWYVYYRNPGDSGLPMTVNWTHDGDYDISDIYWPYPKWKDVPGGLTSYAYEDSILYMMEAVAPEDLNPGDKITLKAETDYLICEDVCIPEYADLEMTIPITDASEFNEAWGPYFSQTRHRLPATLTYWQATAKSDDSTATLKLTTDAFGIPDYTSVIYYANVAGQIENGADQPITISGDTLTLQLQKSTYKSGEIDSLTGIVYNEQGWDESGRIKAMTISVSTGKEAMAATENSFSVLSSQFLVILGFAFLGGLILNAMPCVFPILSIKVMNFVQISGDDPRKAKLHGWVFGAGVLLSFLVLAGLLLLLRAGGQELGWGFQLQTPAFIAFMTFLMFGLGLSLMGVFDIGYSLMNAAGSAETGDGLRGSFFSGVLATILATPCTAPFMGTALGAAITMPSTAALVVFSALGAGMAAPYILLSSFPALMKMLPKPGAWMETFKQFMAFPLFATAIWLAWVYGQQTGINGLGALLVGLLLMSIGIWILHRWQATQISSGARIVSRSTVALLVIGGFLFTTAGSSDTDMSSQSANGSYIDSYGVEWEPYTKDKVDSYVAAGQNVFIDFTADWCITCKANERIAFSSEEVRQTFSEKNFVMVKADWTTRNPEITRALESFGRNGVPLYVIYSKSIDEPMILPELLTPGIVLDALNGVASSEPTLSMNSNLQD